MTYQAITAESPYRGLLKKRFKLLPVALALLLTVAVIGTLLRVFVMRMGPSMDLKPFKQQCEQSEALAGIISTKALRELPGHDLKVLKKRLEPDLTAAPAPDAQLEPQAGKTMIITPVAPPKPRLIGIIYSDTSPSLAVIDTKTVKAGDTVGGWRVIEILQEQVTIKDDITGTTERLTLYENKTKTN